MIKNTPVLRLVPVCVLSLILAGCGDMRSASSPENDGAANAGAPPSGGSEGIVEAEEGRVAAELLAEPERIGPDGTSTVTVANRGEWPLSYGRPITVERWDGEEWVETEESREAAWTMELLMVEPGETGVEQPWPFLPEHTPEAGWYRFTKTVSAEGLDDPVRLTVSARIEVVE